METTLVRGLATLLMALGAGAAIAPKISSGVFGIPVADTSALTWVRATGVRDVALGAVIAASLGDRATLRRVLFLVSFVGLADAATVFAQRGLLPQHAGHLGGFAAMLLTALSMHEHGDGPGFARND